MIFSRTSRTAPDFEPGLGHRARACLSLCACFCVLSLSVGCGGEGDEGGDASESSVTAGASSAAESEASSEAESEAEAESESETGEPPGEQYGPCVDVGDCPPGMFYVCLQDVTEGAVCAPGCETHADCPPPPPGGSTPPACSEIDGRTRCAMLGCSEDADCPTGMTCHIEGPNWCHWPL